MAEWCNLTNYDLEDELRPSASGLGRINLVIRLKIDTKTTQKANYFISLYDSSKYPIMS